MIQITNLLSQLQSDAEKSLKEFQSRLIYAKIEPKDFKTLFLAIAKKQLAEIGITKEYVIDERNQDMIYQLFYFLTRDPKFKGDYNKGIFIAGSKGVGKTRIILIFIEMVEMLTNRKIKPFSAKKLPEIIVKGGDTVLNIETKPIFIDDLGREGKIVNNYGTKETPLIDLLYDRYEKRAITFATTNFKKDTLEEQYGATLMDRFNEMFNVFEMTGKSHRE